jgi:hypothetical protein
MLQEAGLVLVLGAKLSRCLRGVWADQRTRGLTLTGSNGGLLNVILHSAAEGTGVPTWPAAAPTTCQLPRVAVGADLPFDLGFPSGVLFWAPNLADRDIELRRFKWACDASCTSTITLRRSDRAARLSIADIGGGGPQAATAGGSTA